MANQPVNSGEKVDIAGQEGVVVRSVAVRGGVEYQVRVADPDAAANETLKLPPGYNAEAAYGTYGGEELYEEQNRAEAEEREKLDKAIADERADYVAKEQELTDKYVADSDDDVPDPGPGSHLRSAEAARQVQADRAEAKSKVEAKSDTSTPTATKAPGTGATTDPKSTEAGKRNR